MVQAGKVIKLVQSWIVRVTAHVGGKIARVDAVRAHVEEDKRLRRTRSSQVCEFQKEALAAQSYTRGAGKATQIHIHGHASDPRLGHPADGYVRSVGGTF